MHSSCGFVIFYKPVHANVKCTYINLYYGTYFNIPMSQRENTFYNLFCRLFHYNTYSYSFVLTIV